MTSVGKHVLGNLFECNADLLKDTKSIQKILNEVVVEAKLTKVGETYHQFEPFGATGVILLAESHISVHTWPERSMVAVDVFTCGSEGDAVLAFDILTKKFESKQIQKKEVNR